MVGQPPFFFTTMTAKSITNTIVPESERLAIVDRLFGIQYVLKLEPTVFTMAERIAPEYSGAYWTFHSLGNGGFYMSPRAYKEFSISCENGYVGKMSPDALGVAACMYAFSHLSFGDGRLAEACSELFQLLREYVSEHPEARAIFRATD